MIIKVPLLKDLCFTDPTEDEEGVPWGWMKNGLLLLEGKEQFSTGQVFYIVGSFFLSVNHLRM